MLLLSSSRRLLLQPRCKTTLLGRGGLSFGATGQQNVSVTTASRVINQSSKSPPPKRAPSFSRRNFLTDNSPTVPTQTRAAGDEPRFWTPLTILGVGCAYSGLWRLYKDQTRVYLKPLLVSGPSPPGGIANEATRVQDYYSIGKAAVDAAAAKFNADILTSEHSWVVVLYDYFDKDMPTRDVSHVAFFALVAYFDSDTRREWLRRAKRFPTIGGAIGIGMLGAATTMSVIYFLEKNEEVCRNWLGIVPYLLYQPSSCRHVFFSLVDRFGHRLNAEHRQFFQREKWMHWLDSLVGTSGVVIYSGVHARSHPLMAVGISSVFFFAYCGEPLYSRFYPSDTSKAADNQKPVHVPIQEAVCVAVPVVAYLATGRWAVPLFINAISSVFESAWIYPATLPFSISIASRPSRHRRDYPLSVPPPAEEKKDEP